MATRKKKAKSVVVPNVNAPKALTLDSGVYGVDGRACALADFFEAACFRLDRKFSESDILDRLQDGSIVLPPNDRLREIGIADNRVTGDGVSDEQDDSIDFQASCSLVTNLLIERATLLGEHYPFSFDKQLTFRGSDTPQRNAYLSLLAITVLHGHAVSTCVDTTRVFEDTVLRVLKGRGLFTSNLAAQSKAQGGTSFLSALGIAKKNILVDDPPLHGTVVNTQAQDGGVDAIAHLHWDRRDGKWIFVGQATIGKTDTWGRKAAEPAPPKWSRLLGQQLDPIPFLAVPHHVEPAHLRMFVQERKILVLDRLRLTSFDTQGPSANGTKVVDALRSCDVEIT